MPQPLSFAGDDTALVSAIRAGNGSAKAELFRRYAPQLERFITHLLGHDAELADVLQETFVSAWRSLGALKYPNALRPWLFRIAARTAQKGLRSRTREHWLRGFTDEEDEARNEPRIDPPSAESRRAAHAVYALLERLPDNERLAFELRNIEGRDLAGVAEACNVSLATIKRRLQRAEQNFLLLARDVPALIDWLASGPQCQRLARHSDCAPCVNDSRANGSRANGSRAKPRTTAKG